MDELSILDLARATLLTALIVVTPALLVGMFVGIAVSLFQTVTSLQEQTLTLVPKMLAVVTTIVLLLPWILEQLRGFAIELYSSLAQWGPQGP
ncbi:MAG: flagellar biosynthetic protein FliQ [Planctomycetota bacterium]